MLSKLKVRFRRSHASAIALSNYPPALRTRKLWGASGGGLEEFCAAAGSAARGDESELCIDPTCGYFSGSLPFAALPAGAKLGRFEEAAQDSGTPSWCCEALQEELQCFRALFPGWVAKIVGASSISCGWDVSSGGQKRWPLLEASSVSLRCKRAVTHETQTPLGEALYVPTWQEETQAEALGLERPKILEIG